MSALDLPHPVPHTPAAPGMVYIPGGAFRMGSNAHYPEEAPAHRVAIDGFWIDAHPVRNADFARFVRASGYRTIAERPPDPAAFPGAPAQNLLPGSLVFRPTPAPVDLRHLSQWWLWTPGAHWRRPQGPGSTLADRMDHPVVHIAYADAAAYAAWAGKELPSEAQWEYAARGGLEGATYTWGKQLRPGGRWMAHWWHGQFPWQNTGEDGFTGTAPVASFPPNGYGLYDMAGNVWEWTSSWYTQRHPAQAAKACCMPRNPRGGTVEGSYDAAQAQFRIPRRVVKGGSFLCADNYCRRYRPAARRPQMVDTGTSHIGFRCIVRPLGECRD
jgi:formylglycine-generating enzyme